MKLSIVFVSTFLIAFSLAANAQTETTKKESKVIKPTELERQTPRITTSIRPINNNKNTRLKSVDGGVVIGEGEYLTFTKQIMEHSITGQIPADLPKHVKGQTKQEYLQIIKEWANNHPDQFKQKNSNQRNN